VVLDAVGANLQVVQAWCECNGLLMPGFPRNNRGAIGIKVNDVEMASVSLCRRVSSKSRKSPNR
jgi:hypothetical protein